MSAEDRLISVYQLPKVRLTAAPRHVYSSQSQTEDNGYKPSGDLFWQRRQLQNTKQAKNALHMLQTQECSRKFSSAFLSSQTSQPGHVKAPSSTAVAVKGGGHHIRPARSHTTEDRKIKTSSASASTTPSCGSNSCYVDGPIVHSQRSRNLMLQTNNFIIPSTTRNSVEQPEKDGDRPSANSARVRSTWKTKVDDNQMNTCRPNKISDSCSDAGVRQYRYSNASHNNINNSNCLHRSDFARLQLINHASYSPSSKQKVEAGSNASPPSCDDSKRHISVAVLVQNDSEKGSQFTLTATKREVHSPVAPEVVVTASDNADNRSISRSVSPVQRTLQQDNTAVTQTPKSENNNSYNTQEPPSHSCAESANIKIEKRLISNKPMTICTLPVPKPAFVCKPLLPETAASIRPSFSHSTSVARSYHETTRSQRHESLPLTESSHSIEWPLRCTAISRLPYVGADLWELTMQRLQSAVIDKISHKTENEQKSNASDSVTGCEVNSPTSSMSSDFTLQSEKEQSQSVVGRYVKKCLSAKVVRPETKLTVRGSQSTGHLQQNIAEDDEDEAVVDCDTEL